MAFENDTNAGRVQKMIETFGLIEKSDQSNRADDHALQAMMRPLTEALGTAGVINATAEGPTEAIGPATPDLTAGERAALHLADRASLRDLTAALLGRLEAQDARLAAAETIESGAS